MAAKHILAIDQGTTSTRAIVFDSSGQPTASAQKELPQIFPKPGWVEHDPEEIWRATVEVCRGALANAKLAAKDIAGIGITNQRETTVVWDRATAKPVYNAIVWQDRRTSDMCAELKRGGHEKTFSQKTGLLLDPYFAGTKIAWILQNVAGARAAAEKGALAAGTIAAAEHFKHARQRFGIYANAIVAHANDEFVVLVADRKRDLATVFRVLGCIVEQVGDDLCEAHGIAFEPHRLLRQ